MPGRSADASIAFSVTDNLSQSVVKMKNALNSLRDDAEGLQKELTTLQNTRMQLKNIDLKNARKQVEQMRQALDELGESATEADRKAAQANFDQAVQNYNNVQNQLSLVSKQARQTERDLLNATDAISKADNRAEGRIGANGILSALGKAGLGQMAGDAAQEIANTLIGSSLGDAGGAFLSSGLSGAISGAAMGSLAGPIGTAVGAAIGGAIGLVQGGTQMFQGQDEAFKGYYQGLYEQGQTAASESLSAGSETAAQRELDAIAFNRLLGEGVGDQYLEQLRALAADTPLEYSGLTSMSRALATGFGDTPERMLELITAIGDAGSAVGVTASDMETMAQALSRMNSSGKATLEYLNIFQDRGVDVIGMLGDAMGRTQGQIYDMISKGEINGQDAANIIQAGMESMYGGAMETMASTFSGLTSTLEDTKAELDNARGEGYNTERAEGLQAEIDAYGGLLGQAVQNLNTIAGQNEAYMENLSEQYTREALSAVLLGQQTSGIFDTDQQKALEEMRDQFLQASADYENGSQEAGLQMESLQREAEALATAAYRAWALEVAGVGEVKVVELANGNGTVGLTVVDSNFAGASEEIVADVAANVQKYRPVGADVTVTAAAELPIHVTAAVVVSGITAGEVQAELEARLAEYCRTLIEQKYQTICYGPDQDTAYTLYYNRVLALLLTIDGVQNFTALTVNGGTGDVNIPVGSVPVPGEVTVT